MAYSQLREFQAMGATADILAPLTVAEQRRVINWLRDYFLSPVPDSLAFEQPMPAAVSSVTNQARAASDTGIAEDGWDDEEWTDDVDGAEDEAYSEFVEEVEDEADIYESLESFYAFISPKTARQKVATVAWWLENEEHRTTWHTFDITKSLKSIAKPLRYISTTITQEKRKEDPLIEQVSKDGDNLQSHGSFQLTDFGRAYIEGHLATHED